MRIEMCKTLQLPKIKDILGNLTFIETNRHVPLILNEFIMFMIFQNAERGGHVTKSYIN